MEKPRIRIFEPGDIVTTETAEVHNVFVAPRAVIHTVKHGAENALPQDWHAAPDFDEMLEGITEAILLALRKQNP